MIKIMLACSAGMSTSLLVTKMEDAAKENGIEAKIWAISEVNLKNEIENCDVLLLGPQVRNMMDYGRCNGKAVLDRAVELNSSK